MLQLGIRGLGIARFKFNPISWFLKGEPGAWYDPSDLTTLFQDSAGTIPVTAVGTGADQPVGLMLDKSKGLALGAELVVNGGPFVNTTGWTSGRAALLSVVSGVLRATNNTNAPWGQAYQAFTTVVGKTYKVTVSVTNPTTTFDILIGSTGPEAGLLYNGSNKTAGTYTLFFTATTTTSYLTIGNSGVAAGDSFDLVSATVKEIAGNHAFQATAGNRPVLSARVNLLTKTEDFSDGVWGKPDGALSITGGVSDPLGGSTAFTLTTSAVNQRFSQLSGLSNISASVWIRRRTGSGAIGLFNGTAWPALAITSDWKLFSVSGGSLFSLYLSASGDAFDVWHPDVRPTNSGALLPAYQRVNTASDYDTVGFPLYLKFNGTSSMMSTNSIDFSSTDKMTVVTGYSMSNAVTYAHILNLGDALQGSAPGGFWFSNTNTPRLSMVYQLSGDVSSYGGYGWLVGDPPIPLGVGNVFSAVMDGAGTTYATSMPYIKNQVTNSNWAANGTVQAPVGTFGNLPLFIGRAFTTTFNGQFYGAIIRGAQSDTASVTQTEQYMAQKTGISF